MEKKIMRIGISLPGKLLDKFDKTLLKRGYSSRSEGIRDSIRTYNQHYEWMQQIRGRRLYTIAQKQEYRTIWQKFSMKT